MPDPQQPSPRVAVVVALSLLTSPALGSGAQVREAAGPLAEYYRAIECYRSGDVTTALEEAGAWDQREAARHVREFLRQRQHMLIPPEAEADRIIPAAVMLHTELYMQSAGADTEADAAQAHLRFAQQLLALLVHPDHQGFIRRWHLLVGVHFQRWLRLIEAREHLEPAVQRFPSDEDLLLALGSVHETLASPRAGVARRPLFADETSDVAARESDGQLRSAEQYYRRALAVNPKMAEARLRLGRVLLELGSAETAVEELAAVPALTSAGYLRYLAWLFGGRAHETAGRHQQALVLYRAAAASCPECQVPGLAMSVALDRAGDRQAASLAIDRLLGASALGRPSSDPWRLYDFGQRWRFDEILERVRNEVQS